MKTCRHGAPDYSLSMRILFVSLLFGAAGLATGCMPEPLRLEARYAAAGREDVLRTTDALDDDTPLDVWWPASTDDDNPAPLVVWANGSGATPQTYESLLHHLASWGFVVAAADDPAQGDGGRVWQVVQHARRKHGDRDSDWYGRLNIDAIATMGTSQGSTGALNAVGKYDDCNCVQTVVANALPALQWADDDDVYEASDVRVPVLVVSGELDGLISPVANNQATVAAINSPLPSVAAHLRGAGHLEIEGNGGGFRGYTTAWLRARLLGDTVAAGVFFGPDSELSRNGRWKDISTSTNQQ